MAEIIERVRPSVVLVRTHQGRGSGVIFDTDDRFAYVVTNHHVIEAAATDSWKVQVTVDDSFTYDGIVVGYDFSFDLAVIRIQCNSCIDVPFGQVRGLRTGTEVTIVGYPAGSVAGGVVATRGIVSGVGPHSYYPEEVIQTDAAINPGNSGGPMFSLDGKVIGINTFKEFVHSDGRAAEGIGFAIPATTVQRQVARLLRGVRVDQIPFYVDAGQETPVNFKMQSGTKLSYEFVSDLDINFRIYAPNGSELLRQDRTFSETGTVTASEDGVYTLVFDNSFSIFTSKELLLTYTVDPTAR